MGSLSQKIQECPALALGRRAGGRDPSEIQEGLWKGPPDVGHPGHQAKLLDLQPQRPVAVEVAVGSRQAIMGPRGEVGL